jgi:hypothetical protein
VVFVSSKHYSSLFYGGVLAIKEKLAGEPMDVRMVWCVRTDAACVDAERGRCV